MRHRLITGCPSEQAGGVISRVNFSPTGCRSCEDRRIKPSMLLITSALALTICGEAGAVSTDAGPTTAKAVGAQTTQPPVTGTTIALRSSRFGKMLINVRRQAIYVFENDRRNKSTCYGACAKDWPPVFTRGTPRAGTGVRAPLLGSFKRRDGRLQVTYAGKPLYYYAGEDPGEVRCHNVNLNGGLWWVVGPDGKRRP